MNVLFYYNRQILSGIDPTGGPNPGPTNGPIPGPTDFQLDHN